MRTPFAFRHHASVAPHDRGRREALVGGLASTPECAVYHITNPRITLGDNVVVSAGPQGLGKPNVSAFLVTFVSLNLMLAGMP